MESDKPTVNGPPTQSFPRTYEFPDPLDPRRGDVDEINEYTDIRSLDPARLYELNQNHLDDSVSSTDSLVTDLAPLTTLRSEYDGGADAFKRQIDYLIDQGYVGIRRSRGDGDCFYRSLAFAYIERIFDQEDRKAAVEATMSTLEGFLPKLREAGFEDLVIDDCYEVPRDLVKGIVDPESVSTNGATLTRTQLLEVFRDDSLSDYMVTFMRMITSAQIRGNPEEFESFLTHPDTGGRIGVVEFCQSVVEVLGKEADHVQLTALSQALKVNLEIAYLDGRGQDGRVEFVAFKHASDENETPLTLIYRPGHYDVLDRRSGE
ncbi:peptidase C65 Otubain-domain-containing protein [Russula earlei]|uniref:Peptidase C65 Otubain-domain-containing protein n=1 Tax=Russula earlei TaxID=71964 RepID=A0ACC0TYX4_9AGAM|nr:peptidase C65 Otubain-domain-containing protein [Russula earlei]